MKEARKEGKAMSVKCVSVLLYLFLAVFSLAPDILESQDCINYGDYIHLVGGVDTPDYATGVAVSGSYAYVADGISGLRILPVQCDPASIDNGGASTPSVPRTLRLSQNYPNPFNPSTTIEYAIPEGAGIMEILVAVYDLRGRLIKKLVDREQGTGHYQVHWDGKDESDQTVGSGVYLLAIKSGAFESRRKMVMVR